MAHSFVRVLEPFKGGWLTKSEPPVAEPGTQLVVYPEKGDPYTLPTGTTMRSADYRSARAVYVVSMNPASFNLTGPADSISDTFTFMMRARVQFHVSDPLRAVERNSRDVERDALDLVTSAVTSATRDLEPNRLAEAQRTVRAQVEGPTGLAARWFSANGYQLDVITVTLSRDAQLIEREKQIAISKLDEEAEDEKRRRTLKAVEFTRQMLSGDRVQRYAYLIAAPTVELRNVLAEMTQLEVAEQQAVFGILKEIAPSLDQGRQEMIFKWLQLRADTGFSQSPALQSGTPKSLLAGVVELPVPPASSSPADKDDWDE